MFKYAKYTPATDEYTTHIFNEKNEKCTINYFSVPFVSIECENEGDFAELMAYQNVIVKAVEITKEEFNDAVQYSNQVRRMYTVANNQFIKDMEPIFMKYSNEEVATWGSQVDEAKKIKNGNKEESPFMDALVANEGIDHDKAADKILKNKTSYDTFASSCLVQKWETLAKLKGEVGL